MAPRRRSTVGLVVPELTNPYFAVLADEIVAAADQQSICTAVFSAAYLSRNERTYVELTQSLGLDGLLYVGTSSRNDALNDALSSGLPLVVVDEPQDLAVQTHTVLQDDYSGAFQAVSHLIGLGHREIGFISGSTATRTAQERYRAYVDVLRRHGVDPERQFYGIGSFTEEYGATALAQILASDRRPSAVFVASDIIAVGLAVAATSMRVRIPDELSIVGYDDIPAARYLSPPLTTVHSPLLETARAAVDLIVAAMRAPAAPPQRVVVPVGMVIRESAQLLMSRPGANPDPAVTQQAAP